MAVPGGTDLHSAGSADLVTGDQPGRAGSDIAETAAVLEPSRPRWWQPHAAGLVEGGVLWIGAFAWAALSASGTNYVWADHFASRLRELIPAAIAGALLAAAMDYRLFRRLRDAAKIGTYVLLFPVWLTFESLVRVGRLDQWMFVRGTASRGPLDPDEYS
jgi:hypothetical protein